MMSQKLNYNIFFLTLFLLFFITSGKAAEPVKKLIIESGQWPSELTSINTEKNNTRQIIFSTPEIIVNKNDVLKRTIEINEKTIVYVPKDATVKAKPMVYTHPELSDEIRIFYTQGIGSYAIWAAMIGIAMAFR